MESLLGQSGGAPEDLREHHPDGSWRADALAKSRHARLTEHLREPLDEQDPGRSRQLCAAVCRDLLGDFAPALMGVASAERFRCQVLACWLRTLFDFARQPGVEGERLAALNRLGFSLEQSLGGEPVGQPVFVGMALEESRRAWPRGALDLLMASARRRVVQPRLSTPAEVENDASELAGAICLALVGQEPAPAAVALCAGLLRLRSLLDLGAAMRRDQAGLPLSELPSRGDLRELVDRRRVDGAVRSELARIRPALEDADSVRSAEQEYRAAASYLRRAGLALADRIERLGWEVVSAPPQLGLGSRLGLLIRSRMPQG